MKRILPAIGHIKLAELQPIHLIRFYKKLEQDTINEKASYISKPKLKEIISQKGLNEGELASKSGLSIRTIKQILNGGRTNKAKVICDTLQIPIREVFNRVDSQKNICGRTVLHHHRLISSILSCAVHWQMIESNCALRIKPPKVHTEEMKYFDEDNIKRILELLEMEPIKYKAMLYVAIFSGCRLGELGGLEWKSIDFTNTTIKIEQATQYLPGKGIFVKETKNKSSVREITMPDVAMEVLEQYKAWQNEQRLKLGEHWEQNKESDDAEPRHFVFTQWNGKAIFPSTPSKWFKKFREKHGLPDVVFHGIRHSNASILVSEQIDVQTIAKRLGHSKATTTTSIYSHFLQKPDREAATKLNEIFGKNSKTNTKKVEEIADFYNIVG